MWFPLPAVEMLPHLRRNMPKLNLREGSAHGDGRMEGEGAEREGMWERKGEDHLWMWEDHLPLYIY